MKHLMRASLLVLLVLTFNVVAVSITSAAGLPANIVTCGNTGQPMCTICSVVDLGMNVLNFFVFFSLIFATLLFVNAGVLYLFSPANPGNVSRAHHLFTNTLVGILIILTAWLVVDTVMKNLYDEGGTGWGPWNAILCKPGGAQPTKALPPSPAPSPVSAAPSWLCDLKGSPNMSFTNGSKVNCAFGEKLKTAASAFQKASLGTFIITEACPTTYSHKSNCHLDTVCTCIDMRAPIGSQAIIGAMKVLAQNFGARYETETEAEYNFLSQSFKDMGLSVCANTSGGSSCGPCNLCWYSAVSASHIHVQ